MFALPLVKICLPFPPVAGTFSCTMKFTVRDCDPNTGVPDEDGYDDEYVVSLPCVDPDTSATFNDLSKERADNDKTHGTKTNLLLQWHCDARI